MFNEVLEWLWAWLRQWQVLVTGGTITAILAVIQYYREKSISWHLTKWVLLFFVLAAFFLAWREERHKALALNEELKNKTTEFEKRFKPQLECRFDQWTFFEVSNKPGKAFLIIQIALKNEGAPSFVEGWQLTLTMPDGKVYQGYPTLMTDIPFFDLGPNLRLYQEDCLYLKHVDDPIETGGRRPGWVLFRFDGAKDYLYNPNATMDLSYVDVQGTIYHTKQVVHGEGHGESLYFPGFKVDLGNNRHNKKNIRK
jgi:hypothetical protein